jgi:bifunctional polynucleotide phosphatase/kinase
VPMKLRELHREGYQIIIFTNQGRLTNATGGEAPEAQLFKLKLDAVLKDLDVPLTLYAACANDIYRKPRTGMWDQMLKDFGRRIRIEDSYLVGDAAGRVKDHSDSDRHFCMNIGIGFITPEEFFLNKAPLPLGHKFDPAWYLPSDDKIRTNGSKYSTTTRCCLSNVCRSPCTY